jgi:N-acetyl-alpha-D-muramate 1-phosphate uridylyltransferase|tara:strand:- start:14685 stop:15344 length:660 start_codon:yes stop_codon:yes gene_type:complete
VKAMILAAGEGRRMLPLTAHTPKPLLKVHDKALIEWHLEGLARAGFAEIVINVHYQGDKIQHYLGDGSAFGLHITYSVEPVLLETAGGIHHALAQLGTDDEPFAVVNGDIYTDFDFSLLPKRLNGRAAILVMVDNPLHHPSGDFSLTAAGQLGTGLQRLTYSGVGVYSPSLFRGLREGPVRLREVFAAAIEADLLGGQYYGGHWTDVGTPARLAILNAS